MSSKSTALDKVKREMLSKKQRSVSLKVVLDVELADKLEYILEHTSEHFEADKSVFLSRYFFEDKRKFIEDLYADMSQI